MRMKITVWFVHTLIIMKILVLLCKLHVLCCFVIFSSLVMYVEYFKTLKHTVGWKVVTGAYFKVCSYFARVSDVQLQSNFLLAVS